MDHYGIFRWRFSIRFGKWFSQPSTIVVKRKPLTLFPLYSIDSVCSHLKPNVYMGQNVVCCP